MSVYTVHVCVNVSLAKCDKLSHSIAIDGKAVGNLIHLLL